mgnify:CR=1 FL=1
MATAMPIWKLVIDGKVSLSEVRKWDLEDIDTACSLLDMRSDFTRAREAYLSKECNKK